VTHFRARPLAQQNRPVVDSISRSRLRSALANGPLYVDAPTSLTSLQRGMSQSPSSRAIHFGRAHPPSHCPSMLSARSSLRTAYARYPIRPHFDIETAGHAVTPYISSAFEPPRSYAERATRFIRIAPCVVRRPFDKLSCRSSAHLRSAIHLHPCAHGHDPVNLDAIAIPSDYTNVRPMGANSRIETVGIRACPMIHLLLRVTFPNGNPGPPPPRDHSPNSSCGRLMCAAPASVARRCRSILRSYFDANSATNARLAGSRATPTSPRNA